VPGYLTARVVIAKSLSAVIATAVTSTARVVAPNKRVVTRCIERPNATVQRAVVDTLMRIGSVDSVRVNEKK